MRITPLSYPSRGHPSYSVGNAIVEHDIEMDVIYCERCETYDCIHAQVIRDALNLSRKEYDHGT